MRNLTSSRYLVIEIINQSIILPAAAADMRMFCSIHIRPALFASLGHRSNFDMFLHLFGWSLCAPFSKYIRCHAYYSQNCSIFEYMHCIDDDTHDACIIGYIWVRRKQRMHGFCCTRITMNDSWWAYHYRLRRTHHSLVIFNCGSNFLKAQIYLILSGTIHENATMMHNC